MHFCFALLGWANKQPALDGPPSFLLEFPRAHLDSNSPLTPSDLQSVSWPNGCIFSTWSHKWDHTVLVFCGYGTSHNKRDGLDQQKPVYSLGPGGWSWAVTGRAALPLSTPVEALSLTCPTLTAASVRGLWHCSIRAHHLLFFCLPQIPLYSRKSTCDQI